jgi:XTP/dITP diphosphohydrolase
MPRGLKKLEAVVARLLSPAGCPWDRAQTHKTLVPYLREESKELADAIAGGKWHEVEDELGDLLFHIFFHSKIAEKAGQFSMDDVAESQAKKLVRRHPHVFGRTRKFEDEKDVRKHWDEIKAVERALRAKEVAQRRAQKKKKR